MLAHALAVTLVVGFSVNLRHSHVSATHQKHGSLAHHPCWQSLPWKNIGLGGFILEDRASAFGIHRLLRYRGYPNDYISRFRPPTHQPQPKTRPLKLLLDLPTISSRHWSSDPFHQSSFTEATTRPQPLFLSLAIPHTTLPVSATSLSRRILPYYS
jgi:hypothetical protein